MLPHDAAIKIRREFLFQIPLEEKSARTFTGTMTLGDSSFFRESGTIKKQPKDIHKNYMEIQGKDSRKLNGKLTDQGFLATGVKYAYKDKNLKIQVRSEWNSFSLSSMLVAIFGGIFIYLVPLYYILAVVGVVETEHLLISMIQGIICYS